MVAERTPKSCPQEAVFAEGKGSAVFSRPIKVDDFF